MKHLTDGTLQAYLDDELSAAERSEVEVHLDVCGDCAAQLGELKGAAGLLASALALMPESNVALLEARAGVAKRAREARPEVVRTSGIGWSLSRAALLVLALAAAASATIPGSPVRRWIEELLVAEAPPPAEAPPAIEAPPPVPPPVRAPAEVTVAIQQGEIRVALSRLGDAVQIRVRFVEGDRASVQASGAAAGGRFTTGPGRIELIGPDSPGGEVLVLLPRVATRAEVSVNGRAYLEKDGTSVRLLQPAADTAGSELLFRPR